MKVGKSERASGRRMQDWRRTRVVVGSSRAAAQETGWDQPRLPSTWAGTQAGAVQ